MTATYCRKCNKVIKDDEPRYKASVTMGSNMEVISSDAICGSGRCQLADSTEKYAKKYENK